jgi:hypothetical protein
MIQIAEPMLGTKHTQIVLTLTENESVLASIFINVKMGNASAELLFVMAKMTVEMQGWPKSFQTRNFRIILYDFLLFCVSETFLANPILATNRSNTVAEIEPARIKSSIVRLTRNWLSPNTNVFQKLGSVMAK